jgi:hypothetical protein
MAMARRTWGGKRTANGARTQQVLASVLRTCWQQGKSAFDQLVALFRPARPVLAGDHPRQTVTLAASTRDPLGLPTGYVL